ncbi:MAG: EAL domain-containing protein [Acidimicrobiia bacterium]|nr:EAL domain-containing protein [Acidimicrobiia bacterium]
MAEEPSDGVASSEASSDERLRAAERELRAADERFRLLVEGARDFISYRFRLVPDQRFEHVSGGTLSILGVPPQVFLDDPDMWDKLIHPDDREKAGQELDPATPVVMRWRKSDSEYVVLEHRRLGVYDADGNLVAVEGLAHDVTEATVARHELEARERRFTSLVQNVSDLIIVVDRRGEMQYASPSLERLLGYVGEEQVQAMRGERIHPDDLPGVRGAFATAQPPGPNTPVTTARSLHKDGSWRWLEYSVTDLRDDPSVHGYVVVARDITERKNAEAQLVHQTLHDTLTGLPNRALFLDRLGLALSRLERRQGLAAVFFLDLDYFKVVNDSLGHSAGDQVLVAVGNRLEQSLRDGDTAARLGGDEFAVLCDDLVDEGEAVQIAERLGAAIAACPVVLGGRELVVTVSIGVAFATQSTQRPESLLRDADAAMYRAKERGRARYELFDAAMRTRAVARLETEAALRMAIDREQLSVSYQPEVLLADGSLVGAEALLRWRPGAPGSSGPDGCDGSDAELTPPPSDVIAVAEETGLIVPIGAWVVREACRHLARWREIAPDRAPERVAVNLSGRQLAGPELPDVVEGALDAAGISAGSLCLEITESVLMEDIDVAIGALKSLKAIGVEIAVDCFGTGYSSLAHLRRFPVDILKIDHSFVAGLGINPEDAAIVRAILALARTLDLAVVAEGVERAEQLYELRDLGCERAQGNLFAAPLSEPAFADLLVNG